jgi:hypothetical protein
MESMTVEARERRRRHGGDTAFPESALGIRLIRCAVYWPRGIEMRGAKACMGSIEIMIGKSGRPVWPVRALQAYFASSTESR